MDGGQRVNSVLLPVILSERSESKDLAPGDGLKLRRRTGGRFCVSPARHTVPSPVRRNPESLVKIAACVQTPHGQMDEQPMGCRKGIHLYALRFKSGGVIPCSCYLKTAGEDENTAYFGSARAFIFAKANT